jgi:hypothetical protein
MMEVNVDLKPFLGGMREIPDALLRELRKEIRYQTVEVQKVVIKRDGSGHRHITRTGMLNNSVQTEFADDGLSGKVGFNPNIAIVKSNGKTKKINYGIYVHEGHGTWKPDRFLPAALEKREPLIRAGMENAVKRGLKKAGA